MHPDADLATDDGPGPEPVIIEDEIESSPTGVRRALDAIMSRLARLGLEAEERGSVEIVMAEALNNIVEHAYASAHGPIHICLRRGASGLICVLRDEGDELPDGKMPFGRALPAPAALDDLPEGGFGWFMIRQLAHDLSYSRAHGENRLSFRIAVAKIAA